MHGEFTKGPAKTADKNVEVTMIVCNKQGGVLQVQFVIAMVTVGQCSSKA